MITETSCGPTERYWLMFEDEEISIAEESTRDEAYAMNRMAYGYVVREYLRCGCGLLYKMTRLDAE